MKMINGEGHKRSNFEGVLTKDFATITCKIHGDFKQRLHSHISGDGCRKCRYERNIKDLSLVNTLSSGQRLRVIKSHCEICGQGDTWNGLPLTLEIDHIDGNRKNNATENLRTLCPNCHRQQVTTGKSKKKLKEVLMENPDLNPEAAKSLGVIED